MRGRGVGQGEREPAGERHRDATVEDVARVGRGGAVVAGVKHGVGALAADAAGVGCGEVGGDADTDSGGGTGEREPGEDAAGSHADTNTASRQIASASSTTSSASTMSATSAKVGRRLPKWASLKRTSTGKPLDVANPRAEMS